MALTDKQKTAHMLRRFGLGASEAELDFYGSGTYEEAVDKFLSRSLDAPEQFWDAKEFANAQGIVNIRVMQGLWYARLCLSTQPLREKMTIFWHDHFAVGANKVINSHVMGQHVNEIRQGALGSFHSLLRDVSRSPAMIYWLDGQENVVGKAQENFGREVLELFTLGVGNYTEKDVQETARAFTGWSYLGATSMGVSRRPGNLAVFAYRADLHDSGEKVILGKKGNLTGDDVLDLLCKEPRTALYITEKIWHWFVSPQVSTATLNQIAKVFSESDLNIAALLKAIMLHPEFTAQANFRKLVKNPIDFCVATTRALGVGTRMKQMLTDGKKEPRINEQTGANLALIRAIGPAFALLQSTTSMGMELMEPPDVAGWQSGTEWITSATMSQRIKWSDALWAAGPPQLRFAAPGSAGANRPVVIGVDPGTHFDLAGDAAKATERLFSLFDAEVGSGTRSSVAAAMGSLGGVSPKSVQLATKVLFASPEFQMM